MQIDREAALLGRFLLGREILDVDLRLRPLGGRDLERAQHRPWPAAIKMRGLRRGVDDRAEVEHLAVVFVVEMKMRLRVGRELVEKRHVGARPAGVIKRPSAAAIDQAPHHAADRCDADAAGDEDDQLGVLHQRKVVARQADLDGLADVEFVMDVARAAAARRVAFDAERVGRRIRVRADQRILPHQAVRQMQVDMRARLERRQFFSVDAAELLQIGVARREVDVGEANVDQRIRCRIRRRCRCGLGRIGGWAVHVSSFPGLNSPLADSRAEGEL